MAEALPPPQQPKILLVDDKSGQVRALADYLVAQDYCVILARNGAEALEKITRENPSVVMLDVVLAGMDGFEVCRRIRTVYKNLYLPVILVTGSNDGESRRKGAQAGADDFLSRPVDKVELLARVTRLVHNRKLYDALQQSLEERTRQLETATSELKKFLKEKIVFTPDLAAGPAPRADGLQASGEKPATEFIDRKSMREFKRELLGRLTDIQEGRLDLARTPENVSMLGQRLAAVAEALGLTLSPEAREALFREIVNEIVGFGPIEPLLADPSVSEVMVNGPQLVYAERGGKLVETGVQFDDNEHVMRVIERIIKPLGRRIDRKSPMVDARLPDGSRVNAIIPPCAIDGPTVTIRKFRKDKLTVEDLIKFGSLSPGAAEFLRACVCSRLNIVISGGTGSGKTTLLNVLSSFIPENERIVTIEDAAELQLHQRHTVRLETRTADFDGSGEVPIRGLVRNALRMRPDRIVVGEVRGGEALDMLQAMNTGHDGSLATVHANTPRDAVSRLETLVLMAGMDLPLKVVRTQIASAVNLIVQQSRLRDGSRKVTSITEIQGMESDIVVLSEIFSFKENGQQDDRVSGALEPAGLRPKFTPRLEMHGFRLGPEVYMPPNTLPPQPQPEAPRRWR